MEDFLVAIFEVIAEVLLELFGELLLEALVRTIGKFFSAVFKPGPLGAAVAAVALGATSGALSLAILPHPLVHPSRVHGISLLISPAITGLVMAQVGRFLRSRGKQTIRIESFAYGFAFAFAMEAIRLMFAK